MTTQDLHGILIDQQRDLAASRKKWIERDIQPEFKSALGSSLVKVIMGIRRSGKSTLCTQAAPDDHLAYCNFDDERLAGIAAKDLNSVYEILLQLKPNARFFVFDGIQNVDHWELFVNRLKRKGLNLLITGSNGKLLSMELATHLTGRHIEIELMPFSFVEYLHFNNIKIPGDLAIIATEERAKLQQYFQTYFERGGFPEIITGNEDPNLYLRELFNKIISRDIMQRYDIRTPKILKQLGLFLIQQSGSLTSLKRISDSFQYKSINTLRSHIDYLHDSYLLYEVSAYSPKVRERSTSPKKHYACDTGMMAAMSAKPSPDWGMRFETLIFLHLRRTYPELFYVKSPEYDIDFAVIQDWKISRLIQVCYDSEAPETLERELASLCSAARVFKNANLQLVTHHEEGIMERDQHRIEIIPGWKFLLQSG